MSHFETVFRQIIESPEYLRNIDWGRPRRGHPEGTVRAHIEELELNLAAFEGQISPEEYWKLQILIHVHDSFKADAKRGVPITHPESHASLARKFLQGITEDRDLLNMVQYHDEPYALWRQNQANGSCNRGRLDKLLDCIDDWCLFFKFLPIDGMTYGKSSAPLYWAANQIGRPIGFYSLALESIKLVEDSRIATAE